MKQSYKLLKLTGSILFFVFFLTGASFLFAGDPVTGPLQQDGSKKQEKEKKKSDDNKTGVFYGKKVNEKLVVFCLDASGSMSRKTEVDRKETDGVETGKSEEDEGPDLPDLPKDPTKLDVAKWQLKKALLGMDREQGFNIIFYNDEPNIWQKNRMIRATPKAKKAAFKWIDKVEAEKSTNIFDSLKEAFKLGVRPKANRPLEYAADAIYLLSDGKPNRGEITDEKKIRKKIRSWNKKRKLKIHTVGIGLDGRGGPPRRRRRKGSSAKEFLKKLAKENGGVFIEP